MTATTEILPPLARTGSDQRSSRDFITGEDSPAATRSGGRGRQSSGGTGSYSSEGSDAPAGELTGGAGTLPADTGRPRSRPVAGALDAESLRRAISILDDIESDDAETVTLKSSALRAAVCRMWDVLGADERPIFHRIILAAAESAILSAASFNADQAAALRGAFVDLTSDVLTQQHVDVIQSRLNDVGFGALSLMSEFTDDDPQHAGG